MAISKNIAMAAAVVCALIAGRIAVEMSKGKRLAEAHVPIVMTNIDARATSAPLSMAWKDDETLVVDGRGLVRSTDPFKEDEERAFYTWEVGATTARKASVDEERATGHGCEVGYGALRADPAAVVVNGRRIRRPDCAVYRDPRFVGRAIKLSSDGASWIDMGRRGTFDRWEFSFFSLHVGMEERRFKLPMVIGWECPSYGEAERVFVLFDCNGVGPRDIMEWKATNCRPVFLVYTSTMTMERVCVPFIRNADGLDVVKVSGGLAINVPLLYEEPRGKLVVLRDGELREVIRGIIFDIRVSPDGCRVAFNHMNRGGDGNAALPPTAHSARIAFADFCK